MHVHIRQKKLNCQRTAQEAHPQEVRRQFHDSVKLPTLKSLMTQAWGGTLMCGMDMSPEIPIQSCEGVRSIE